MVAAPGRAAAADLLTGLPTRHFFEERLAAAARRCDAKRSKLAVLFIDLDGFKPVNDTFGHAGGDRVLESVGAAAALADARRRRRRRASVATNSCC